MRRILLVIALILAGEFAPWYPAFAHDNADADAAAERAVFLSELEFRVASPSSIADAS